MWRISLFILLVLSTGCKKDPAVWQIKNLNGNKISVFGHGGMGIHSRYPMNSYESLSQCMQKGVAGTEMDICVTKDSVLILCHTQDLGENTDCRGLIRNSNSVDLHGCHFKKPLFARADLIDASYFFDRVETNGEQVFTFDCKTMDDSYEYYELFARALLKHINKYKLQDNCFIESFNIDFLKIVQSKNKDLRLFLYTDESAIGLAIAKEISLYGLTMDMGKISAEEIQEAHRQNLRITLFNASTEKDNLEAIQKNPDYIQSDKIEYLINALKD